MMKVEEIESLRGAREVINRFIKELERQRKSLSRLRRLVPMIFLSGFALGIFAKGLR